jgi:CRP/FNR family transcriptional regulator
MAAVAPATAWSEQVYTMFPFLENADTDVHDAFFSHARHMRIPSDQVMCSQGQSCPHLALLLKGHVRVYKIGAGGREVTLYRVAGGDSCVLSAACILSGQAFPAYAVTESEIEVLAVPSTVFRAWADQHTVWRQHVFGELVRRLTDVIDVLEDVTFRRMDVRLATYLLAAADADTGRVSKTHQAIAGDLGSSREVVSRLLKEFERGGALTLSRGSIHVGNSASLRSLAAGSDNICDIVTDLGPRVA